MPQSLGRLRNHSFTRVLYIQTATVISKYTVGLCQLKSANISQRAKKKKKKRRVLIPEIVIMTPHWASWKSTRAVCCIYRKRVCIQKTVLKSETRGKKKSFLQPYVHFSQDSGKWYTKNESKYDSHSAKWLSISRGKRVMKQIRSRVGMKNQMPTNYEVRRQRHLHASAPSLSSKSLKFTHAIIPFPLVTPRRLSRRKLACWTQISHSPISPVALWRTEIKICSS